MIRYVTNEEKHLFIRTLVIVGEVCVCRFCGLLSSLISSFASLLVERIIAFFSQREREEEEEKTTQKKDKSKKEIIYVIFRCLQ